MRPLHANKFAGKSYHVMLQLRGHRIGCDGRFAPWGYTARVSRFAAYGEWHRICTVS